jgi:hypothetical protein
LPTNTETSESVTNSTICQGIPIGMTQATSPVTIADPDSQIRKTPGITISPIARIRPSASQNQCGSSASTQAISEASCQPPAHP